MCKYEMEKKTVYGFLSLNALGKMHGTVQVNLISDHSSVWKIFLSKNSISFWPCTRKISN